MHAVMSVVYVIVAVGLWEESLTPAELKWLGLGLTVGALIGAQIFVLAEALDD